MVAKVKKSICYNASLSMEDAMKCECLFCQNDATARLTVPQHKPRTLVCEEHLEAQLAWAAPYRTVPGRVQIERVR